MVIHSTFSLSRIPENQGDGTESSISVFKVGFPWQPAPSLGAFQKSPHYHKPHCGKGIVMNSMTPMSPLGLWSDFRNWGKETKYCKKRCPIALISGNFKGFRSCEPRKKTKCIWEIYFGHLNDQIHISYNSQYHSYNFFPCDEILRSVFLATFKYMLLFISVTMLNITSTEFINFITGSLYLLTPFTHFPYPQFRALATTNLFCFCICFGFFFFLESTKKWHQIGFVFLWLISLNFMSSSSTHVIAHGKIYSFYGWTTLIFHCIFSIYISKYIYIYLYIPGFLYPFISWWTIRLFHILGIIYNDAVNHGEGSGTPLQYSCLEHPMDEEAW